MKPKEVLKKVHKVAEPFRVDHGKKFHLDDFNPADTLEFGDEDKPRAKAALASGIEVLAQLQDRLYAQDNLPGDGRGWQGRGDQTRHVRPQSAGLPGLFF